VRWQKVLDPKLKEDGENWNEDTSIKLCLRRKKKK